MTETAHTAYAPSMSAAAVPPDVHAGSEADSPASVLLPVATAEQEQMASLPLAAMAALLTSASTPEAVDLIEDIEPEAEDALNAASSVSQPPPLPLARGLQAVAIGQERGVEVARQRAVEVAPERAELQVEDLSLRFDNPYRASSLIPPARKFAFGKGTLLTVCGALAGALLALASGGYLQGFARVAVASNPAAPAVHPAAHEPARSPLAPESANASALFEPLSGTPAQTETRPERSAMVETAPVIVAPSVIQLTTSASAPAGKHSRAPARTRASRKARHLSAKIKSAPVAKVAAPGVSATPVANLPQAPSRQEIIAGFGQLHGELARCADGHHGVAEIHATVVSTGHVSKPHVSGVFENSPASMCMERAVRNMSFARFAHDRVSVTFPVAL